MAIAGWASMLVAGTIFFALAWDVATRAPLVLLDARVAAWLHLHGSNELAAVLFAVTQLNSTVGTGAMTLALAAVIATRREWYWLLSVALGVGGAMLLNLALKLSYARARPTFEDPWITLTSFSFPSGHTAGATAFYGVLAAYLVSRTYGHGRRAAIVTGAVLAVMLVAFSRMYLGAHFLSDVVAAAASTAAWLTLVLAVVHRQVKAARRRA
jgi:undecaprenyl-diphosphatase